MRPPIPQRYLGGPDLIQKKARALLLIHDEVLRLSDRKFEQAESLPQHERHIAKERATVSENIMFNIADQYFYHMFGNGRSAAQLAYLREQAITLLGNIEGALIPKVVMPIVEGEIDNNFPDYKSGRRQATASR